MDVRLRALLKRQDSLVAWRQLRGLRLSNDVAAALKAHRGRRGTATLNALVSRYERLQLHRCRSDAEAYATEILDEAKLPLPQVNAIVAGEEADLSWPGFIIEIDGPGYHVLTNQDARKTSTWKQAGNDVGRIDTDTLFAHPQRLVALAHRASP
jgi:hypothetical protein